MSNQSLHISNLPWDFTDRELYLLYTTMPGFMSGHIKYDTGRAPIAFVTFNSAENAQIAMAASNGLAWMAGDENKFRVAFAKESSKTRTDMSGRVTTQGPVPQGRAAGGGGMPGMAGMPGMQAGGAPGPIMAPEHIAAARYNPYGSMAGIMGGSDGGGGGMGMGMGMGGGRPPRQGTSGSTLYVTVNPTCPLDENMIRDLATAVGPMPIQVSVKGGRAWIKYNSPDEAGQALPQMDGYQGIESGNGRLSVVYARNDTARGN